MKRLIASDLHGSAVFCRQLLALYRETGAEQLVLLGDLAYSGSYDPRYEYDPQNVIDQLNAIAPDILWVEGNCDYGVGALRPRFPGSPKYLLQEWEGRTVFLTHGHRYGPQNPPPRAWQKFYSPATPTSPPGAASKTSSAPTPAPFLCPAVDPTTAACSTRTASSAG